MTPTDRERALAEFVDRHGENLVRFVYGMVGDRATAEDLAQDTMLRAYERWHQLGDPNRVVSWLYAIARNNARQHLRRDSRWTWLPWSDRFVPMKVPDPATLDGTDGIRRAMARLSEQDREVLLLVGIAGLSSAEAAQAIGIGSAALQKRWQRACRRFRQVTEEQNDHAL